MSGRISNCCKACTLLAIAMAPVMSGGAAERAPMLLLKPRIEMAWTSDRDSLRDALARSELHFLLTQSVHLRCEFEQWRLPAGEPELGLRVGLQYRFR